MKVLLPTPGTPDRPMRSDLPLAGSSAFSNSSARARWSARLLSRSVMVLASARRWRGPCPSSNSCSSASSVVSMAVSGRAGRRSAARRLDLFEHFLRAHRDRRARAEDALDAGLVEELVVLLRDHAADEHDDVAATLLLQLVDDRRHQRLVPRGQRADADRVHVVLDCLARALLGRLEQRTDVDVEAEIGE